MKELICVPDESLRTAVQPTGAVTVPADRIATWATMTSPTWTPAGTASVSAAVPVFELAALNATVEVGMQLWPAEKPAGGESVAVEYVAAAVFVDVKAARATDPQTAAAASEPPAAAARTVRRRSSRGNVGTVLRVKVGLQPEAADDDRRDGGRRRQHQRRAQP